MKIFQVYKNICYWDATKTHLTINNIVAHQYPAAVKFIEAPDYVREGWGFDETAESDARFVEPTPPEGWLYDQETGTFYPDSSHIPIDLSPNTDEIK